MKVYLSVDMEGVTGITHWDEAEKGKSEYEEFRAQMTAEAGAACEGALAAGAAEIWVKDAHATGRNLIASRLPRDVRLIRAWSEDPLPMMQELDGTFDAAMMVGYHAGAGRGASPLEHTFTQRFSHIRLNGGDASEFLLNAYYAAYRGVPVVLLSGDERQCKEATALVPQIATIPVMRGLGRSTVSIHPELACERIREAAESALRGDPSECRIELPEHFDVEIGFQHHSTAHRMSFYPGATQRGPTAIACETDDYFDVKRLILFAMLAAWS